MKLGTIDIPAALDNAGDWIFQLAITPGFWIEKFPALARPTVPPFVGLFPVGEPFYVLNLASGAKTPISAAAKPLFESKDSAGIYQRGYGITFPGATNGQTRLFTVNLAPCVSVIIWQPSTQIAALSHWDAEQDYTSLSLMLDEYKASAAHGEIHIYFHGGKDEQKSALTTKQLLAAIYAHPLSNSIVIQSIDITVTTGIPRQCATSIGIDTRGGLLSPQAYTKDPDPSYDSKVRLVTLPNPSGTYAAGIDGVDLKNYWDGLHVRDGIPITAAQITQIQQEARKIRKQFDGRDNNWIQEVSTLIFTYPVLRALFIHPTAMIPSNDLIDFVRNQVSKDALFIERSLQSTAARDANGEPTLVNCLIRVLGLVQISNFKLVATDAAKKEFNSWATAEKKRQGN